MYTSGLYGLSNLFGSFGSFRASVRPRLPSPSPSSPPPASAGATTGTSGMLRKCNVLYSITFPFDVGPISLTNTKPAREAMQEIDAPT